MARFPVSVCKSVQKYAIYTQMVDAMAKYSEILELISPYRRLTKGIEAMSDEMLEMLDTNEVSVAIDPGNGRVAAIVVGDNGQAKTITFPSAKSLRGASSYQLFARRGLRAGSFGQLRADEHIISWDGIERFVGRLAVEEAAQQSDARNSATRYYDGWINDYVLVAIARATNAPSVSARVALGVPAELWADVQADVIKALKGTHRFEYNGTARTVRINEVIVDREGQAAWRVLPENQRNGRVFIIDIGDGTANIIQLLDGEIKRSTTLQLGVATILDDLDNALIGRGLRKMTQGERIGLMDALRDQQPYSYTVNNRPVAIDQLAKSYFNDATTTFVQLLQSRLPLGQADHIWFIGGAVYFMGDRMQQLIPVLKMPTSSPELMNALGYAQALGIKTKKRR